MSITLMLEVQNKYKHLIPSDSTGHFLAIVVMIWRIEWPKNWPHAPCASVYNLSHCKIEEWLFGQETPQLSQSSCVLLKSMVLDAKDLRLWTKSTFKYHSWILTGKMDVFQQKTSPDG